MARADIELGNPPVVVIIGVDARELRCTVIEGRTIQLWIGPHRLLMQRDSAQAASILLGHAANQCGGDADAIAPSWSANTEPRADLDPVGARWSDVQSETEAIDGDQVL